jgi:hypothetical protein
MFIFKKPKIVIDCFISNPIVNELHPIDYAAKFTPEEWRKLPKTLDIKGHQDPRSKLTVTVGTMKKCAGFQYLHSHGFIIPAWSDMAIETGSHENMTFHADPTRHLKLAQHPRDIMWPSLYKGYAHIKIENPWFIREKSGVKFTWNGYPWANSHLADRLHFMSAVTEFQAQYSTNINVFLKLNSTVTIPAGAPLVQCIPITDKDWTLKTHSVSMEEYSKIHQEFSQRPTFINHHKTMVKHRQQQLEETKCPFKKLFGA